MKRLLFISLLFVIGCANHQKEVPSWVNGIRSGEETHKVVIGSKILFRRIAGSTSEDREKACEEAISKAENDLKNNYPYFVNIPYTLEVLYYDDSHDDCAVTISISSALNSKYEELKAIQEKFSLKESELEKEIMKAKAENVEVQKKYDELSLFVKKNAHVLSKIHDLKSKSDSIKSLLNKRSEVARLYAYSGLREHEFAWYIKDRLSFQHDYKSSLCDDYFRSFSFTIHGDIHVCWKNGVIAGLCTYKDCWVKVP